MLGRLRPIVAHPTVILAALIALALALRVVGSVPVITSDEGYWAMRTLRFGAALAAGDLDGTYRSGHPGVTVMWVGLLGIGPGGLEPYRPREYTSFERLQYSPGYLATLEAARFAISIVTASLTVLTGLLALRLLGPAGALGAGLAALDPYLVGSTRLLHVDALLAPLMAVSVLAGLLYWLRERSTRYLMLSAVAGGLALLTKAPAVVLGPYFALVWLVATRADRSGVRPVLAWGAVCLLVYAALWPAVWVDPVGTVSGVIGFVRTIGGSPHVWPNFFLGQVVLGDPGPLFYPVALLFRLGPIVTVGLLALAVVGARQLRRRVVLGPTAWLLLFVGLFVLMMTLGPKKFDRYLLPAIVVLDVLAGVGLWALAGALRRPDYAAALVAMALWLQAVQFWLALPYPIAAYNPLLGGAGAAGHAILLGWGEGLEQAARYLNGLTGADRPVASAHYHHVLRPLFVGDTIRLPSAEPLDYYVVYAGQLQRNLVPTAVERAMVAGPPEFTAYVNGVPYAWVYRVAGMVEPRPGDDPDREEGAPPTVEE